jgi:large subunit ribosomal protein L10
MVIVEYRGVSVSALETLRRDLRKEGAFIKVYKNTLVERAAHDLDLNLDQELVGPNAFVFSNEDAVSAPKIIAKAAKKNKNLVVKGGVVEGKVCNAEQMKEVAKLPSREGLYAMILSCIQAPIRGVACAIKAVADAKENA